MFIRVHPSGIVTIGIRALDPVVPRMETAMSVAEEERCKELLVQWTNALDMRARALDELGKTLDKAVSSLAVFTPLLVGTAGSATTSSAINEVPVVIAAAPNADDIITTETHTRLSTLGPDTNTGDKSVAALSQLTTGTSMVVPVPMEHSTVSSLKPISTTKFYTSTPTRCSMVCLDRDTSELTSPPLLQLQYGPLQCSTSVAPTPSFLSTQPHDMVTLESAPSTNFLRKCPRTPTSTPRLVHGQVLAVFAPTGSYPDPAPPLTVVLDAGGVIIMGVLANTQQDTVPDDADSSNPTSTPSGAAVNSIDLGDEHVPKLSSY